MEEENKLIILLLIIIALVAVIVFLIYRVRRFTKRYSLNDIKKAYNIPTSKKDDDLELKAQDLNFPIEEIKKVSSYYLSQAFKSIENHDLTILKGVSALVAKKVFAIIKGQENLGQKEYFENIEFTDYRIENYQRKPGYLSLLVQVDLDFIHYIISKDQVIDGSKDDIQKEKFLVSLIYIENLDEISEEDLEAKIYEVACRNCDKPIGNLAEKSCAFCNKEFNRKDLGPWLMLDYARL